MPEHSDLRGLRNTLILYIVIFLLKLAVYLASGVMALLAESLHTLTDIFVAGFLLVAALYSRRKADQVYMFGYGRAQNVAALVAATLFISFTSFELYREAIPHLFEAQATSYQNLGWAIGVLAVSMLIAAYPLVGFLRQKQRGAAAKAQMLELINDELGLLAALLGTLAVMDGFILGDPLASMVVATIIAINAVGLFRENLSILIGRAPDAAHLAAMKAAALSVPGVLSVHKLRSEAIGPDQYNTVLHIRVNSQLTVLEGNRIAEEVERRVCNGGDTTYCMVHLDPARPATHREINHGDTESTEKT